MNNVVSNIIKVTWYRNSKENGTYNEGNLVLEML